MENLMNIKNALKSAQEQIPNSSSPLLDCQILLGKILNKDKIFFLIHNDFELSPEQENDFFDLIKKRSKGLPVAYLTGTKEFFGRDFIVSPDVLIPKPDTETLVELALNYADGAICSNPNADFFIADICCGSGCIGISLVAELLQKHPAAKLHLDFVDISPAALKIAIQNKEKLLPQYEQCNFFTGDLTAPLIERGLKYNLIVSNPPYVPSITTDKLLSDGRNEPRLALDGGADGIDLIKNLVSKLQFCLKKDSPVFIESGEYNAAQTAELLKQAAFSKVKTHLDLAKMPRVTSAYF